MGALDGRVAAVTGASRGIGLASARALLEEGARVALLARDAEALEAVAKELGPRALALPADVADAGALEEAFARVARTWGRLDLLVSNAAVALPERLEEASPEELRGQIETNLLGPVLATRAALPLLRARRGLLVYVSSDAAVNPFPLLSVYSATKGAVEVLAEAMRRELRGDGVRVTLVRPGPTRTSFGRDWPPEAMARAMELWTEGGYLRPGAVLEPEAVAAAVLHAATRPPDQELHVLDVRPGPSLA